MTLTAHLDWRADLGATIAVYSFSNAEDMPPIAGVTAESIRKLFNQLPNNAKARIASAASSNLFAAIREFPDERALPFENLAPFMQVLAQELELRTRLAKEAWLVRGPGWLAAFNEQTASRPVVWQSETIQVVIPMGEPQCWGSDNADDPIGIIAATLYDPDPGLPEWLRVGWLIARRYLTELELLKTDQANTLKKDLIAALLVLISGEAVEATPCDLPTLEEAVARWSVVWSKDAAGKKELERIWGSFQRGFSAEMESGFALNTEFQKLLDWTFATESGSGRKL